MQKCQQDIGEGRVPFLVKRQVLPVLEPQRLPAREKKGQILGGVVTGARASDDMSSVWENESPA